MAQGGGNSDLSLFLRIRTLVQGADSLEDLRRDVDELGRETADAGNAADGFNDGLDRLDGSARKAGAGVKSTAGPLGEFKGLIGDIAIAALAKQTLDLNDELTGLRRGFDTITESSEKTIDALKVSREVADDLGVGVHGVAQNYLELMASSKGTQLEGAATEQIFRSLSRTLGSVNASQEQFDNAMTAVAQIMGKTVVGAEELRGQLGDALPGAVQQAAQALFVTNAEFSKMLESGEIIASEFLPKFAAQLEKTMGGGQTRVEGFAAAWARLTNQLTDLATGPVGAGFTSFVATLTEKLGILVRGAGAVGDAVGAVGTAIGGLAAGQGAEALDDLGTSAENAALKLFGIKTATEQAAETQKQMRAELAAIVPEMTRFQDAIARKDLKALPEYLQAAVAELKKTGDAAAATEQAVSKFIGSIEKGLNLEGVLKLAGALQAVGQEAQGAGGLIENTLAAALEKVSDEQLVRLKAQAEAAMAAASKGSDEARRAFADLGLVIEAVAQQQLKRAADAARDYAAATDDYSSALERVAKAQISGLRAEIDLARAKGETWTVQQKSVELAKLEAQWAQTLAAAQQFEIQAQQQATAAKIAELNAIEDKTAAQQLELSGLQLKLQALGQEAQALQLLAGLDALRAQTAGQTASSTQPIQENTQAIQDNSAALAANITHTNDTSAAVKGLGEVMATAKDETAALSEKARLYFDAMVFGIGASQGLNDSVTAASDAVVAFQRAVDGGGSDALAGYERSLLDAKTAVRQFQDELLFASNGIDRLETTILLARETTKAAFFEQQVQAEQLAKALNDMAESGRVDLGTLAIAVQGVSGAFTLLDEQDLGNLQSAIDAATERLQRMQGEAADARQAIAELNAEILAEKGDTAAAAALRRQIEEEQKLADLEAARARAQLEQNTELVRLIDEQIQKTKELFDLKEQNARADANRPTTTSSAPSAGGGAASGGSGVSITVNAGNAKLLDQNFVADLARQIQPELSRLTRLSA